MTLSMHASSVLRDRTLPNPASLSNGTILNSRRSSSLSIHQINSDRFLAPVIAELEKRRVLPSIAADLDERRDSDAQARSDGGMSDGEGSDSPNPADNPSGFCLCQPERKVPRPRNAFILYRQRQHASVVARHPGLPNPDISKIIGEQWRALPPKEKNEWKALAEQEKVRHSELHPNYRYRPKRGLKANPEASTPTTAICQKCGGKTMNPPSTPQLQGFSSNAASDTTSTQAVSMSARAQKRAFTDTYSQPPRTALVHVAQHPQAVRYGYGSSPRSLYDSARGQAILVAEESDTKRRRVDGQITHPSASPFQAFYRRQPMAHGSNPPSSIAVMAPPRALFMQPQSLTPRTVIPLQQRKDFTLPPINTNDPPRPLVATNAQTQQSGVESMIMSQTVLSRLKTQSSITPPLSHPEPGSPPFEIRGTIIAIEGLDRSKVAEMCNALADQLEREGKFAVRIFGGPDPYITLDSSRKASTEGSGEQMSTAKYLDIISQWHKISREMVEYVTTKPMSDDDSVVDHNTDDKVFGHSASDDQTSPFRQPTSTSSDIEEISPRTTTQLHALHLAPTRRDSTKLAVRDPVSQSPSYSSSLCSASHPVRDAEQVSSAIPVALVPHYQLTTVDTCAIALPITDNYDPLTHWRWHATLWRGCVGPDITVVIDGNYELYEEANRSKMTAAEQDAVRITRSTGKTQTQQHQLPLRSGGQSSPRSQHSNASIPNMAVATPPSAITPILPQEPYSVEVRLHDHRAVIIKANTISFMAHGKSEQAFEAEKVKEQEYWKAAKRRVGFEVEEFLRR